MTTMIAIVAALLFAAGQSPNARAKAPNVIFVCEHRAAKSEIATAAPPTSSRSGAHCHRSPPSRARPQTGPMCRTIKGTRRCGTRSCVT
jgi:hypothetical protein